MKKFIVDAVLLTIALAVLAPMQSQSAEDASQVLSRLNSCIEKKCTEPQPIPRNLIANSAF